MNGWKSGKEKLVGDKKKVYIINWWAEIAKLKIKHSVKDKQN